MGEPWCKGPHEIACLTDAQIIQRIFAKRDENGRLVEPVSLTMANIEAEPPQEPALPERNEFIADAMARFGQDEQYWAGIYDANQRIIEEKQNGQSG